MKHSNWKKKKKKKKRKKKKKKNVKILEHLFEKKNESKPPIKNGRAATKATLNTEIFDI